MDEAGHLAGFQHVLPPASGGREAILEQVIMLARAAVAAAPEPVRAVGVATGGQVDVTTGIIIAATELLPG